MNYHIEVEKGSGFVVAETKPLKVPGLGAARHVVIIRRKQTQEHAA